MSAQTGDGYSAKVEISLHVAAYKLNVARIRGGELVLRDRIDVPPCDATVVISVDGQETVTPVVLVDGIDSQSEFVRYN
jgi:hypothetical protein